MSINIGSYGLLYVHDDETKINSDVFVVYKLARGKFERIVDTFLSPLIPTVEIAYASKGPF